MANLGVDLNEISRAQQCSRLCWSADLSAVAAQTEEEKDNSNASLDQLEGFDEWIGRVSAVTDTRTWTELDSGSWQGDPSAAGWYDGLVAP